MNKKIKIGLIGPGLIGKKHICLIKENSNTVLGAIVAPDNHENYDIAAEESVPLFEDLENCLRVCNIDAVILASPNEFHADQARVCLDLGMPVLIEKPITSTVEEGIALVKLAKIKGAKVLVGHHRNYSPILLSAAEIIKRGQLGKLVSIIGSAQFYKPSHYFEDGPWRKNLGGGPILINLIHEISNMRILMGEIKAVQAIASSGTRGYEVEDTVAINLIFENGALGTFLLSDTAATAKSWEQTSRENPSYPSYTDEDCYSISGTQGSLCIPTMRLKYYGHEVDPSWWTPFSEAVEKVERLDPLKVQLEHFVRVINGEELPIVTAEDGLKNLIITEAIRESIKKKSMVEIQKYDFL
jgi:predicted dehydrogenase